MSHGDLDVDGILLVVDGVAILKLEEVDEGVVLPDVVAHLGRVLSLIFLNLVDVKLPSEVATNDAALNLLSKLAHGVLLMSSYDNVLDPDLEAVETAGLLDDICLGKTICARARLTIISCPARPTSCFVPPAAYQVLLCRRRPTSVSPIRARS